MSCLFYLRSILYRNHIFLIGYINLNKIIVTEVKLNSCKESWEPIDLLKGYQLSYLKQNYCQCKSIKYLKLS